MAITLVSNVGTTMSAATGRSSQRHLVYATNTGQWYLFYLSGTQNLNLAFTTSSNFNTAWNTSSATPLSLSASHNSECRNFGFAYASVVGEDHVHMNSTYFVGTSSVQTRHAMFKLNSTGWTTANSENPITSRSNVSVAANPSGATTIVTSTGVVMDCSSYINSVANLGDQRFIQFPGADTTTTWTPGTGTQAVAYNPTSNFVTSNNFADLGSGNVLNVCDNASTSGAFTQLEWSKWTTSWSAAALVLAATDTSTSSNNWGMVGRTTTEIHVVALSNGSNAFVHRIFNGTSWANGASIPTLTLNGNSGIFLATDGTSVWAFAIDSTFNVSYVKYSSGAWSGSWTVLQAGASISRTYISGFPNVVAGSIGVIWTEVNGSNFNINGTTLGLPLSTTLTTTTVTVTAPTVSGAASGGVSYVIDTVHETTSAVAVTGAGTGGVSTPTLSVGNVTVSALNVTSAATGGVSQSLDVGSVTASTPNVTYAADQSASIVVISVGVSAPSVSAQGTGGTSTILTTGSASVIALVVSGAATGAAGVTLDTSSVGVSSPALSGLGTGGTSTDPGIVSVAVSAPSVTGAASGAVSIPLSTSRVSGLGQSLTGVGTGSTTTSLATGSVSVTTPDLSESGSGSALWTLATGSVAVGAPALSGSGTGGVSTLPGTSTVLATAPDFGAPPQSWSINFATATASAPVLSAAGTGTATQGLGLSTVVLSASALSGAATGGITTPFGAAQVSITTPLLSGAPTGSASSTLGISPVQVSAPDLTISPGSSYSLSTAHVSAVATQVATAANQQTPLSVAMVETVMANMIIPTQTFYIVDWSKFVSLVN